MQNISNPTAFGYGSGEGGYYHPTQNGQMQAGPAPANFAIQDPMQQAMNPMSSAFNSVMGADSFGKGGFMSSLPGYAISAFSAYDQNKTNKLNRKATQYALDRKQTEDKAYDKYKSDWSGMSFKA